MTNIKLHGIIAKDFGQGLSLSLDNVGNIMDAMDANNPGFIKKLNELSQMGLQYCLIIDGVITKERNQLNKKEMPKQIDFVPIICGQGVVLAVVGAGLLVASGGVGIAALIGGIFLSTGLSMLLAPKQDFGDAAQAESSVTGLEKSFAFANKANMASQGVSVPVGYGRMRVGSLVVQGTIKTYPQNLTPTQAMENNAYRGDNTVSRSESEISE